jgi:hypothetical protein
LYTWLKFGHLVGLVLLSGGMVTQMIAYAGLLRAGTVGELRTWQKLPKERLTDGDMGLLILTGLAMAGQGWSFTDGWILAAIGVLAVTIAAAVAGVGPRNTRLKAALAAAGDGAAAAPAELTAPARDPVLHGAMRLQLVALLEIVYLMVRKPSGVGILVPLLVAGWPWSWRAGRWWAGGRRPPGPPRHRPPERQTRSNPSSLKVTPRLRVVPTDDQVQLVPKRQYRSSGAAPATAHGCIWTTGKRRR